MTLDLSLDSSNAWQSLQMYDILRSAVSCPNQETGYKQSLLIFPRQLLALQRRLFRCQSLGTCCLQNSMWTFEEQDFKKQEGYQVDEETLDKLRKCLIGEPLPMIPGADNFSEASLQAKGHISLREFLVLSAM